MKRLYLKPGAGRACPDPDKGGELLPEGGDWVTRSVYWQRRITAGDAVESEPEKPKAGAKGAPAVTAGGDQ